jgi:hypothetical protein
LSNKITSQTETIYQLAEEYGTTVLDTRHDMELQTQNTLWSQWIAWRPAIRLEAHGCRLGAGGDG